LSLSAAFKAYILVKKTMMILVIYLAS